MPVIPSSNRTSHVGAVPWPPIGIAPPMLGDAQHRQQIQAMARRVMADPSLKRQLAERVLVLMKEDLRQQQYRTRNYGGNF